MHEMKKGNYLCIASNTEPLTLYWIRTINNEKNKNCKNNLHTQLTARNQNYRELYVITDTYLYI